jgi:hypothetical protein
VAEQVATLPNARLASVTSREGDIAALMDWAGEVNHPADLLIRVQHNRYLVEGEKLWKG